MNPIQVSSRGPGAVVPLQVAAADFSQGSADGVCQEVARSWRSVVGGGTSESAAARFEGRRVGMEGWNGLSGPRPSLAMLRGCSTHVKSRCFCSFFLVFNHFT